MAKRLYCKTCGKHVSSIAHWAKVHRSQLRKRHRTRGKASRERFHGPGGFRLIAAFKRACKAFYGE